MMLNSLFLMSNHFKRQPHLIPITKSSITPAPPNKATKIKKQKKKKEKETRIARPQRFGTTMLPDLPQPHLIPWKDGKTAISGSP